jgi:hypothetical protein
MEFKKENFNQVKILCVGMQGSGKTYLSKKIVKCFKNPLVYGVYPFEWENEPNKIKIFIPQQFTPEAFEYFAGQLIEEQVKNQTFDCLFVDDADLFFNSNFSKYPNTNRLFISQRQLGLTLIFASKRPQNLSTKVYENADFVFAFAIEGVNVKKYLENLHENMKFLIPNLSRNKHNFVLKEIGKEPYLLRLNK